MRLSHSQARGRVLFSQLFIHAVRDQGKRTRRFSQVTTVFGPATARGSQYAKMFLKMRLVDSVLSPV